MSTGESVYEVTIGGVCELALSSWRHRSGGSQARKQAHPPTPSSRSVSLKPVAAQSNKCGWFSVLKFLLAARDHVGFGWVWLANREAMVSAVTERVRSGPVPARSHSTL